MKKLPICSAFEEKETPSRAATPEGAEEFSRKPSPGFLAGTVQALSRKSKYRLQERAQKYLEPVAIVNSKNPEKTDLRADICRCGAPLHELDLEIRCKVLHAENGKLVYTQHVSGISHCGSVFCPSCGPSIRAHRSRELVELCRLVPVVRMLTFTIRHQRGESLGDLMDILEKAIRDFWSNTRKSFLPVGKVRAYECTYGVNGWHPHFHVLAFFESEPDIDIQALQTAWVRSVDRAGGSASLENGLQIQDG